MEVVKFVLSLIGILYGLKWVLGGVTFRTNPGTNPGWWDISQNPPELRSGGLPVGSNVIALQFVFMGAGIVLLYFSIMHIWSRVQPLL